MSRYLSYVWNSQQILEAYNGELPFAIYLKKFFTQNKKFGSRDRKAIAQCCYAWLRCSFLFQKSCNSQNLISALFLCSNESGDLLLQLDASLHQKMDWPIADKLHHLGLKSNDVFPFKHLLGDIDADAWAQNFFEQPRLFLRIRPGKEDTVFTKLEAASVPFIKEDNACISMSNGCRVDELLRLDVEAVVQDKSSQRVFEHLRNISLPAAGMLDVWDCCAASGGKSILLYDILKTKLRLTVTDIRASILHNCRQRLQKARIPIHQALVADVSRPHAIPADQLFDLIICDAPCSGSGTWSRTAEQLAYFDEQQLNSFFSLQTAIALNAFPHLKAGGILVYITCSVFKRENEDVLDHIAAHTSLGLLHSGYIKGFAAKADTMFVAIFQKR